MAFRGIVLLAAFYIMVNGGYCHRGESLEDFYNKLLLNKISRIAEKRDNAINPGTDVPVEPKKPRHADDATGVNTVEIGRTTTVQPTRVPPSSKRGSYDYIDSMLNSEFPCYCKYLV